MPMYFYRWSNSNCSAVFAENPKTAIALLTKDREAYNADSAEDLVDHDEVIEENLVESSHFVAHFRLAKGTEELDMPLSVNDCFHLDVGSEMPLQKLYPRLEEGLKLNDRALTVWSPFGGVKSEVEEAIWDEAILAERENRPFERPASVTDEYPLFFRTADILGEQADAYAEKFDDYPSHGDPIFFDPEQDTPQPRFHEDQDELWEEVVASMKQMKVPPAVRYAVRKTGRYPISDSQVQKPSPELLKAWNAALAEYRTLG